MSGLPRFGQSHQWPEISSTYMFGSARRAECQQPSAADNLSVISRSLATRHYHLQCAAALLSSRVVASAAVSHKQVIALRQLASSSSRYTSSSHIRRCWWCCRWLGCGRAQCLRLGLRLGSSLGQTLGLGNSLGLCEHNAAAGAITVGIR